MYNKLVLSGGGKRGLMLLGSLEYIYQYQKEKISNIKTYIGSSIGSIICYLLILNYEPRHIISFLISNDFFKQFKDINFVSLTTCSGAYDWNILKKYLFILTNDKYKDENITLKQLYDTFNKELICTTFNLSKQTTEYLSYKTHPDLLCVDALRMSSNIPLYFDKFKFNDDYYIDGGITNNFPINLLEENDYALALNCSKMNLKLEKFLITNYMLNLVSSVIINNVKQNINNCICKHIDTIHFDTCTISTSDLYVNINDVFSIFSYGFNHSQKFFNDLKA